jgi:hypothetical protein
LRVPHIRPNHHIECPIFATVSSSIRWSFPQPRKSRYAPLAHAVSAETLPFIGPNKINPEKVENFWAGKCDVKNHA